MEEAILTLLRRRGFLAEQAKIADRRIEKGLADWDPEQAAINAEPEPADVRGARLERDLLRGKIDQLTAALKAIGLIEPDTAQTEEADHG